MTAYGICVGSKVLAETATFFQYTAIHVGEFFKLLFNSTIHVFSLFDTSFFLYVFKFGMSDPVVDLVNNLKTKIATKYMHIGLFFIIAGMFIYFAVSICKTIYSIISEYNSLVDELKKKKNDDLAYGVENDSDNYEESGKDEDDRVNYNNLYESKLSDMDQNIKDLPSIKAIVKMREDKTANADDPYKYDAKVNTTVLSRDFDDYVYKKPKTGEQGFWSYFFNP